MKHLKLLFLLVFSFSIISCSDDEIENQEITAESIVGSWALTSLESQNEASGEILEIPFTSETNTIGDNFDFILTFTESTYTAGGSYDITTTGTLNGVPINPDMESITIELQMGVYSIENNQIIFDEAFLLADQIPEDAPDINFEIDTSIDGNGNLIVNQFLDIEIEEDGVPFRTQVDARIVFTRIE